MFYASAFGNIYQSLLDMSVCILAMIIHDVCLTMIGSVNSNFGSSCSDPTQQQRTSEQWHISIASAPGDATHALLMIIGPLKRQRRHAAALYGENPTPTLRSSLV